MWFSTLLLKSTIQVTVLSFLGIVLGFLTQLVIAFYFGATLQRDAYFAASVIPTYISTLCIGSIGAIFMSSYIRHQTLKTDEEIKLFTSRILNICGIILIFIVVMGIIFAKEIVSLVFPGFIGKQLLLTAKLLRILLPTIIILVLSNLLTTIYQAQKRFLLPSVAPVLGTVITLFVVFLLSKKIGIESLAYGSLTAAIFSFSVLSPIILKNNLYKFSFVFEKEIIKLFKIAAPLFLAGIFYRSATIFERSIASTLEPGSISYLGYANQLVNILASIGAGGIATAIFPVMSKEWEVNNLDAVRKYFAKGIRIVLLVTLPIAVVFIIMGNSIVRLLLERGAFDIKATSAVSNSLSIMMVAFVCLSCGNIVAKAFYLSNKTKIFSIIVSIETIIYLSLGYYLSTIISYLGIAVALSVSTLYTIITSTFMLHKIFKGLDGSIIIVNLIKILFSSIILGLILLLLQNYILRSISELIRTSLTIIFGLLSYLGLVIYLFSIEDVVNMKKKVINYVQNKMK